MKQIFFGLLQKCFPFRRITLLLAAGLALFAQYALALEPALVFNDHMVLQRNHTIPVWGKAQPGSVITVTLDGAVQSVKTGKNGEWRVEFPSRSASTKPIRIRIDGEGRSIVFQDILVGDVWFCSGQSNLGVNVNAAKGATTELKNASHPNLRLYTIPPGASWLPGDPPSWGATPVIPKWNVCTPQTAASFTAIGYVFGSELQKKLDIPVGIINAAFGGAFIEPFIPRETIRNSGKFPGAQQIIQRVEKITDAQMAELEARFKKWNADREAASASNTSLQAGWQQPGFDDSKWKTLPMPSFWQESAQLKLDGTLWFRRSIKLNEAQAAADRLSIGYVRMAIRIWVNGKEISVAPESAGLSSVTYAVPPGTLTAGDNIIAMRIYSMYGQGGLKRINDTDFSLQQAAKRGAVVADLSGDWKYEIEAGVKQDAHPIRQGRTDFSVPGVIWNAMILPVVPFPVTGVIWYQGESNISRAGEYADLLHLLVTTWRKEWKEPELPFLVVQLPNYNARRSDPAESDWASLRAAQDKIMKLPRTRIAVTYDVGEEKELHPRDKRSVGERLLLLAEEMVYGIVKPAQAQSPRAVSAKRSGQKIKIRFNPAVNLKTKDGQAVRGVSITDTSGKFVWVKAEIKGKDLYVYTQGIPHPKRIRYAWADNPDATLVTKNGLPVAPFEIAVE